MLQQSSLEGTQVSEASVRLDVILHAIEIEKDPLKLREFILEIERGMLANAGANIDGFTDGKEIPVQHDFAAGVYLREMHIPMGTVLVGKIHKHEHFNIVMRGDITVVDESGVKRYVAPCVIKSPAGSKRLGYAHENTSWMCIHPTESTDIDVIEQQVTANSYEEIGLAGLPIEQLKVLGG